MKRLLLASLLFTIIAGCATTSVYDLPKSQQKGLVYEVYNYPKSEVFDAAMAQLSTGTAIIANADKDAGIISTDWKRGKTSGIIRADAKAKFSVIFTELQPNKTRVKLNVQQEINNPYGGWEQQKVTKESISESHKLFEGIRRRLTQ